MQELHVELERTRLDRAQVAKDLQLTFHSNKSWQSIKEFCLFQCLQELHVELERTRLDKAKVAKELHAQKMLKERDTVKAAEKEAKMLTMIRELQVRGCVS